MGRVGMSVQTVIEEKLTESLSPEVLQVVNESHLHASGKGAESHFKVVAVASEFEGKRLIARHRLVNEILANELANDIHALGLHTYTPNEWQAREEEARQSPNCMGGEKSH